jgi:hypothetical protein
MISMETVYQVWERNEIEVRKKRRKSSVSEGGGDTRGSESSGSEAHRLVTARPDIGDEVGDD